MSLRLLAVCGVSALLSSVVHAQRGECGPVDFNEVMIRSLLARADPATGAGAPASSPATLPTASPLSTEVRIADFDDPESILKHVFLSMPAEATVYPTETYYYYQFDMGSCRVSGNVRLLDAHEGKLHLGYFDAHEPGRAKSRTFTEADGVIAKDEGEGRRSVTAFGRTVRFLLPPREAERPKSLKLASDERVLAGIFDESGLQFYMTYMEPVAGFMFVLDEEKPVADKLAPLQEGKDDGTPRFFIGQRTRYIFFHDAEYNRKILVGVQRKQIEQNSYYDGPFDQVPPRLGIKAQLEAAYPYVKLRDGIDEHGNFKNQGGARVAISPYTDYDTPEKLVATLSKKLQVPGSEDSVHRRWLRLTYETKRDFHRRVEILTGAGPSSTHSHQTWVSQGWPANHEVDKSRAWPKEHMQTLSSTWPKNHAPDTSASYSYEETLTTVPLPPDATIEPTPAATPR